MRIGSRHWWRLQAPDDDILAGGGGDPAPTDGDPAPSGGLSAEDVQSIVQKTMNDQLAPALTALGGQIDKINEQLAGSGGGGGENPTDPAPAPGAPAAPGALDRFIADPEAFVRETATPSGPSAEVQLVLANQADQMLAQTRSEMDTRYGAGKFDEVILPKMRELGFDNVTLTDRASPQKVSMMAAAVAGDPALAQTLYELETKERQRVSQQPDTLGPGVPPGLPSNGMAEAEMRERAETVGMSAEDFRKVATGGTDGGVIRTLSEWRAAHQD